MLNEPGAVVGEAECEALLTALDEQLASDQRPRSSSARAACHPACPEDAYGRIVRLGHRHGARVLVDASRNALAAALEFGPDAVTPNLGEAQMILDGTDTEPSSHAEDVETTRTAALDAAARLRERGVRTAIVTAGSQGVAWVEEDGSEHWEPSREVALVNPIGAGDSFVGGLAAALEEGQDWGTRCPTRWRSPARR